MKFNPSVATKAPQMPFSVQEGHVCFPASQLRVRTMRFTGLKDSAKASKWQCTADIKKYDINIQCRGRRHLHNSPCRHPPEQGAYRQAKTGQRLEKNA